MRAAHSGAHATIAAVVSQGRTRKIATILAALATGVSVAACGGGGGNTSLGPADAVAIQIGSQKITNGEIDRRAQFLATAPTGAAPTKPPAKDSKEFREFRLQAAEQLRDERVFGILAGRCGSPCAVTDKEVEAEIKGIVDQQFNGSRPSLNQALEQRGITSVDLSASIRGAKQEQALKSRVERKVVYSDAEALAYYRKNVAQYRLQAEKRLSHILVATKAEATAVRAQATVDNFAQLARDRSIDSAAKRSGGDLGAVNSVGLLPEVAKVAQTLKPGQISAPVQSQFGWHILLVRDIKARTKTFDEVKKQILSQELDVKRAAAVQRWTDTVVKREQDGAKYLNPKIKPDTPATTTAATTSASTTVARTSTGGTTVTAPTVSVTPTSSGPAAP